MKHVLIDYENTQPKSFASLIHEPGVNILIFLGPHQRTLPTELVLELHSLKNYVSYIHLNESGPNALDFVLAFHIGGIFAKDPDAQFVVISKDRGYDPLLRKLESIGVLAERFDTFLEGISIGQVDEDILNWDGRSPKEDPALAARREARRRYRANRAKRKATETTPSQ